MLQRFREAGLLWPTLATIVALAILIALGSWQWSRMHWKQGLLRDLEAARAAPPAPLADVIAEQTTNGALQLEKLRFRQVRFDTGDAAPRQLFVWDPQRDGPAWSIVSAHPLAEPVAGADHVFVIWGTVPEKDGPSTAAEAGAALPRSVMGRIRLDAPNSSAPAPVLPRSQWFTRDLESMVDHVRTLSKTEARFLPFFVESTTGLGPPFRPNNPRITIPNRHFEYALTWWGLAATLVGVYAAFSITRLRRRT